MGVYTLVVEVGKVSKFGGRSFRVAKLGTRMTRGKDLMDSMGTCKVHNTLKYTSNTNIFTDWASNSFLLNLFTLTLQIHVFIVCPEPDYSLFKDCNGNIVTTMPFPPVFEADSKL